MNELPCGCGAPGGKRLYIWFRQPRETFEPMAVDPWYFHGNWPTNTCGAAACEAASYLALLAKYPEADVAIHDTPEAGVFVLDNSEDDDL